MFLQKKYYALLKKFVLSRGGSMFGVADISDVKGEFEIGISVKKIATRAVCLGVGLSELVLSEIENCPTKLYFHHYRTANMFLDQLSFALGCFIESKGYKAFPVPASQITDWDKQKAHLSHKRIGYLAGLGWLGRNNLLVNKKFGSQFRLATVLTNMPLSVDRPINRDCADCFECVAVCPAGAIKKNTRDFDHIACFEKLKSYQRQNIVGQFVCGICVKVCGCRRSG